MAREEENSAQKVLSFVVHFESLEYLGTFPESGKSICLYSIFGLHCIRGFQIFLSLLQAEDNHGQRQDPGSG